MGITIHYAFRSMTRSITEARHLIDQLHERAKELPFQHVGEIAEFVGDDCDFERRPDDDPNRWLLIQARDMVMRPPHWYEVKPKVLIAFIVSVGDGCEPMNVGLARYPSTLTDHSGRTFRTGMTGWRWHSFCKTEYASRGNHGGVENFVRCHKAVVDLLDHASSLGLLASLTDEADYWERRSLEALARQVQPASQQVTYPSSCWGTHC